MAEKQKTAHTEAPGGAHKGPFPPFEKETFASQLVWFAICFIGLYLLMSRLAVPRIGGIIEERRSRIENDLVEAQRFRTESDEALATYEKALADARANGQAIANETRDKLHAESEAKRKQLEAELNVKLAGAEKQIAATREAAMANVHGIATEATSAIVERLIGIAPAPVAVEAAVKEAVK
jgi:F-type H+-transporting ATPase subunit b